ncbi:hypothetical protein Pcinc_021314 [Petrolisthes cinctipes]|uniref:Uncharacterized protein n=1 Tax=Petrolisthes cinctipes TaxID=88211 RepID=A0AAE1KIK5_PETCI|nr:hypothetical protein Pcinc_021314 [Petrolisthes cinctipes]
MVARNPLRPLVPGTRKRESAKNLPVATWNVRTLVEDGKLDNLIYEMERMRVALLGVLETHWKKEQEEAFEREGHVIIHAAREDGQSKVLLIT